ncbi:MAG: hypothetical protein ACREDT_00315 [Methylocella sp.]
MAKITSSQAFAAALLACGLSAAPAEAGPNRTFVSGTGTDSGTCTRTAPCRTFAFALTQTNAGGEIDVLDPAGYGAVTIAKAISIVNDGAGTAGITASSGNGVTINAGTRDSVHLRGLTIEGLDTGSNGIQFSTGGNLAIENCVIRGFRFVGVNIKPTGSANVTGLLSKVIMDNNGEDGIIVNGSSLTPATLFVTVVDSVASNNGFNGIEAVSVAGAALTRVVVRNSVANYNGAAGLSAGGAMRHSILSVGHSVVTGNATGVDDTGGTGVILSYGDNEIDGNTFDIEGVLTPIPAR